MSKREHRIFHKFYCASIDSTKVHNFILSMLLGLSLVISHDLTFKPQAGLAQEDTASSGEIFPLIVNNKIVLQGNSNNQGHNVIIKGGGDFVSPTGAGQNVAIAALKDAGRITGITVTNDRSRGHGLWIESSNPEIVGNTFTRNGNTGVSVNGKSSPLIEDNYFYNNSGNGLLVYGVSQPNVVKNTFEQTGFGISHRSPN